MRMNQRAPAWVNPGATFFIPEYSDAKGPMSPQVVSPDSQRGHQRTPGAHFPSTAFAGADASQ